MVPALPRVAGVGGRRCDGRRVHFELAVPLARDDPGGEWLLPHALAALALVLAALGDGEQACRLAAEAVDAARPFDVRAVLAMALCRSTEARLIVGDDVGRPPISSSCWTCCASSTPAAGWATPSSWRPALLARHAPPGGRGPRDRCRGGVRSAAGEPGGGVRAVADVVHRTSDALGGELGCDGFERREPPGGWCRLRR